MRPVLTLAFKVFLNTDPDKHCHRPNGLHDEWRRLVFFVNLSVKKKSILAQNEQKLEKQKTALACFFDRQSDNKKLDGSPIK
jgi:hypothetical protein